MPDGAKTSAAELWVASAGSPRADNSEQVKDWQPHPVDSAQTPIRKPGRGRPLQPGFREVLPTSPHPQPVLTWEEG